MAPKYLQRISYVFISGLMLCFVLPPVAVWSETSNSNGGPAPFTSYRTTLDAFNSPADATEPTGVITLRRALFLVLLKNPELLSFSWEVRAQEARTLQAGLLPNPAIDIEVENFGGSGDFSDFDAAETTVSLSQLIELGGKRSKRKQIASLEQELANWDYLTKRADVLTEATKAFVNVVAAQKRLDLAKELVNLAEKVLKSVTARVKAGKVSPVEKTRAGVAYSTSKIALARAKRNLAASRKQLAVMWTSQTPLFDKAEGQIDKIVPVPTAGQLENLISQNPDIARWATEMEQRRANAALEDAKKIPDPTISLGTRHFSENDDNAFVFWVSIPIPVFNRNQGTRLEARRRIEKAKEEQKSVKLRILSKLAQAYQSLSSAYAEARALKKEVLPGARAAFEASRKGYRQGKFDYMVLLDAQRTLFETRAEYLEALNQYHTALADVERLVGAGLDTIAGTSQPKP